MEYRINELKSAIVQLRSAMECRTNELENAIVQLRSALGRTYTCHNCWCTVYPTPPPPPPAKQYGAIIVGRRDESIRYLSSLLPDDSYSLAWIHLLHFHMCDSLQDEFAQEILAQVKDVAVVYTTKECLRADEELLVAAGFRDGRRRLLAC